MAWVLNSDYRSYQKDMLESANAILSNVTDYIYKYPGSLDKKYSEINDLMNYFYFESEYEIYHDLSVVLKTILIKKYIGL